TAPEGYNKLDLSVTFSMQPDNAPRNVPNAYRDGETPPSSQTIDANMIVGNRDAVLLNENNGTTPVKLDTTSEGVQVINAKGSILPTTGGIGTTIFYIVGGLMMASAVVQHVTKRKMAAEDNE
ncbi:MAG: LPXTG cell wall anchor domain-containing protein, partial [Clostridia bacterium]|nr:LPXTG cell wall anchor domain-containing protein [Clostridia bacterium]